MVPNLFLLYILEFLIFTIDTVYSIKQLGVEKTSPGHGHVQGIIDATRRGGHIDNHRAATLTGDMRREKGDYIKKSLVENHKEMLMRGIILGDDNPIDNRSNHGEGNDNSNNNCIINCSSNYTSINNINNRGDGATNNNSGYPNDCTIDIDNMNVDNSSTNMNKSVKFIINTTNNIMGMGNQHP